MGFSTNQCRPTTTDNLSTTNLNTNCCNRPLASRLCNVPQLLRTLFCPPHAHHTTVCLRAPTSDTTQRNRQLAIANGYYQTTTTFDTQPILFFSSSHRIDNLAATRCSSCTATTFSLFVQDAVTDQTTTTAWTLPSRTSTDSLHVVRCMLFPPIILYSMISFRMVQHTVRTVGRTIQGAVGMVCCTVRGIVGDGGHTVQNKGGRCGAPFGLVGDGEVHRPRHGGRQ